MGRETIIKSLAERSLEWSEVDTNSVDRIAALGMATATNPLGGALLHAEALDVQSAVQVVLIVGRRLKKAHKANLHIAYIVALAALQEYLDCKCRVCGGRGNLYHDGKVVASCRTCDATGLHRYSDGERRAMLGCQVPKYYDTALSIIRLAVSQALAESGKRLA